MNYGPVILGVCVTVLLAVLGLFFRAGHLAGRVEELERWRGNIRNDMQQISEAIGELVKQMANVETLIRERTDRRYTHRETE